MHLIESLIELTVNFINSIGYLGIFIGMFLESTLFPIPSEIVMIPAGFAAAQGTSQLNIYLVCLSGTLGNIFGAIFSYYLALLAGRPILVKIGKYFFVKESTIIKIEKFFAKHGPISIFIGRLLPGFRHFISLPAGIAKMDIKLFIFFTALGSAIWTSALAIFGYLAGKNQELLLENSKVIALSCAIFCLVIVAFYFFKKKIIKK